MTERHLEVERKYDADADLPSPDLSGLPGVADVRGSRPVRLHAAYFDTPDLRLAVRGITLRRRRGRADAGWHLKLPVPGGKLEVREPLGRRAEAVPGRLASLVVAYTRGEPLRQVAVLETRRRATVLLDENDVPLAEVADDAVTGTVLATGSAEEADAGGGTATRWREVEVEVVTGPATLLDAVEERLLAAGAHASSASSKLVRLLGVDDQDGGRGEEDVAAPRRSVGDVVVAALSAQVDALLRHDPAARCGEDDAVHKMRVAARRTRAILRAYGPLFERGGIRPVMDELRWLGRVLGEVRDLEVLRARLAARVREATAPDAEAGAAALPRHGPGAFVRVEDPPPAGAEPGGTAGAEPGGTTGVRAAPSWLVELGEEEQRAYRRMNVTLCEPRYLALLDALDALVADPPCTSRARRPATAEMPALIDRARRRLARKYAALDGGPEDVATARHDVRKAAKGVRYAAETAAPVLGVGAERTARRAKAVQTALGEHMDALLTMRRVERAAAGVRDPAEAFTLGRIHALEQHAAEESLARFTEARNA
ncbi:CYTH and CHAD domain-containing protein [Actinomadura logoneensis]|uniref:CYTH and CHAD domain-containing protein n=1 Tax=Actinomadura logoneensis TaxID=2293572 RepID=UPI001314DA4B|nr:CYTH and CHAD domain-containing protein [Actinomadura logoneensis]